MSVETNKKTWKQFFFFWQTSSTPSEPDGNVERTTQVLKPMEETVDTIDYQDLSTDPPETQDKYLQHLVEVMYTLDPN